MGAKFYVVPFLQLLHKSWFPWGEVRSYSVLIKKTSVFNGTKESVMHDNFYLSIPISYHVVCFSSLCGGVKWDLFKEKSKKNEY